MLDNYKLLCKRLKIDYKKDIICTISISLVILIFGIISSFIFSIAIGFVCLLVVFFFITSHFSELKSKEKQLVNSKEIAFNGFYRYVVSLLKNNNVLYAALKQSLDYIDEVLYDDVNQLIIDIEIDTSLQPFIDFMDYFNDETIKQMIILLYKSQEQGAIDEVLSSINECMVNLQDNSINSYILKEEKTIEKYYMFPIFLSALIIIVVTVFIFTTLGDGIYV